MTSWSTSISSKKQVVKIAVKNGTSLLETFSIKRILKAVPPKTFNEKNEGICFLTEQ